MAGGTAAVLPFAASSVGAAAFAVGAMTARDRRDRGGAVAVVAAGLVAAVAAPGATLPAVSLIVAFLGGCLLIGAHLGARRELVEAALDRARVAEREQVLAAGAARAAERTRIAREMHDVLAHRISLVALHAGALTYRDDLTRAETAETAGVIQDNAQLALGELREVLGVLRAGSAPGDGITEPPQPTLTEVPALLADAREAGSAVQLDSAIALPDVPETVSRSAFRIVQEALTNARRHAPGAPVMVRLNRVGGDLEMVISNPGPVGPGDGTRSGMGLTGLTERAALAGGTLTAGVEPDGFFVVRTRLPWPV
jgi:signal transduction histidine kinase